VETKGDEKPKKDAQEKGLGRLNRLKCSVANRIQVLERQIL